LDELCGSDNRFITALVLILVLYHVCVGKS
jgi:hypothetical protein